MTLRWLLGVRPQVHVAFLLTGRQHATVQTHPSPIHLFAICRSTEAHALAL